MTAPYWQDEEAGLQLYHGDMRDILPELAVQADLVLADPPYAETSLDWDRWPDGWLKVAAAHSNAMWCFGSQRMFFDHLDEFRADWIATGARIPACGAFYPPARHQPTTSTKGTR